jgi:hypothetical protein
MEPSLCFMIFRFSPLNCSIIAHDDIELIKTPISTGIIDLSIFNPIVLLIEYQSKNDPASPSASEA